MFLALVTETYPPEVNGVARTLQRLVLELVDRGHRLQVVRPRRQRGETPGHEGPSLEHVPMAGMPLPMYRQVRIGWPAYGRLIQAWGRRRPDVVHIATEGPLGLAGLLAAKRLGIPVSSSFHTNFQQYTASYGLGLLRWPINAYLRWFHNRCRCTMAPSVGTIRTLASAGYRRLLKLGRGVQTDLFRPEARSDELRRSWGVEPDERVVMYVGRIAAEKNIPLAVHAFEAMRQAVAGLRFVLVGDGPARQELQAHHPEYIFAGMQHGQHLAAHYASADLFLFPSTTETFGNVVTEAMASGLGVIAYRYAAAADYIQDGVNGYTAELGDEEAFVKRAVEAAQADAPSLDELRSAARRTAEGLSWPSVVDQFEAPLVALSQGLPAEAAPPPQQNHHESATPSAVKPSQGA